MEKGRDYESLIITQNSHAGYYPGAVPMTLKLLFAPDTGKYSPWAETAPSTKY